MDKREILIKNMVCPRCIYAVQDLLNEIPMAYTNVGLGKVSIQENYTAAQFDQLEKGIIALGFEILKDKEERKIEKIKNLFSQLLLEGDIPSPMVISQFITSSIPEDYTHLSHLFSSLEGITIEKYFINLKIEKVKELLSYAELNISEIALQLGYSSVQHLSSQFKKVTGMTPTEYKNLILKGRKYIPQV